MARDGFGHGAAAGIAEADEEHLGFFRRVGWRVFWLGHDCSLSSRIKPGGGELRPYKIQNLYRTTRAARSGAFDADGSGAAPAAAMRTKSSWTALSAVNSG